jgi:integrase
VRFCLLAGNRRGEAAALKWSDVMNDRIVIPAEITKKGRPHAIPRTPLLNEVLAAASRLRRASNDLVFPGRGGRPFSGFTKALNRLIEQAGTDRFSMHDTRRTCRTVLGRLGFSNEVQRQCVGQQAEALDRVYNKDDNWDSRCEAFKAYHSHIRSLVDGNVISFKENAQALAAG